MLECDNWTKHTLRDLDIYVPEDKLKRVVRILKQTGDYKVLKKKEVAQRDEDDDASYYDVTGDTGICSVTKLALRRVPDSRIELIAVSCAVRHCIHGPLDFTDITNLILSLLRPSKGFIRLLS